MMKRIIEIGQDGSITLPTELLEAIAPNKRFAVEIQDKALILHPVDRAQPFWQTATPQERAKRLLQWTASHQEEANLSDEAMSRDNIYN